MWRCLKALERLGREELTFRTKEASTTRQRSRQGHNDRSRMLLKYGGRCAWMVPLVLFFASMFTNATLKYSSNNVNFFMQRRVANSDESSTHFILHSASSNPRLSAQYLLLISQLCPTISYKVVRHVLGVHSFEVATLPPRGFTSEIPSPNPKISSLFLPFTIRAGPWVLWGSLASTTQS